MALIGLLLLPAAAVSERLWVLDASAGPEGARELREAGAIPLGRLPGQGYLFDLGALDAVAAGRARSRWTLQSWPLEQQRSRALTAIQGRPRVQVQLLGLPGVGVDQLAAAVTRLAPDVRVIRRHPNPRRPRIAVEGPGRSVDPLIRRLQRPALIYWAEPYTAPITANSESVEPLQANTETAGTLPQVTPIWDADLMGSGQIIGIADTGVDRNEQWFTQLDTGSGVHVAVTDAADTLPPTPGPLSPDNKVIGYWVMPGATAYDDEGHGSHVAATALGDRITASTPTEPNYDVHDGMAPNAQLLVQDLGTGLALTGEGGAPMWAQARSAGAFIHSNSYGSPPVVDDSYRSEDAEVDDFLWRNRDMLILFAAGNTNDDTAIWHPGLAKNVATVGALQRGNSLLNMELSSTYGSSRGPTPDGRIKPDVMAPGQRTRSACTNPANDDDGPRNSPANCERTGTSMAAPAVAGMAAMSRQYLLSGFYPSGAATPADALRPSGALLKALLINGTENQAFADTPSFATGWGRVWLENSLYFDTNARDLRLFDLAHGSGLAEGEQHDYQISVAPGSEFRASLVWYDPAGMVGGPALVNDLDLEVITPSQTYLGNDFSNGESTTGGVADSLNTVEGVILRSPETGPYTVRVRGKSVPGTGELGSDRQGYALVVSAAQCDTVATAPTLSLNSDGSGVQVTAAGGGGSSYQVYRADGDCTADPESFQLVGTFPGANFLDASTVGGFSYAYRLRAADGCGEGPVSACSTIVSQAVCNLPPAYSGALSIATHGDACAATLSWDEASATCPGASSVSFELFRSTDPFFDPEMTPALYSGALTRMLDLTAPAGQTHYYQVRARDDLGNVSTISTRRAYPAFASQRTPDPLFVDGGENLADGSNLAVLDAELPWQITAEPGRQSEGQHGYHNGPATGGHGNNVCAAITTPPIDLQSGGSSALSFMARFELEVGFDGVVLEISADGGASWQDLPPDGGYPGSFASTGSPPINACGYPASQGAFSGDSGGVFQPYSADLSAFQGQTVQLRWRFSSDPGVGLDGFDLDDVQITESSVPDACIANELLFLDSYEG